MDKFYYLSSCDTCKRIMKTLELPSSIDLIDIKKTPLSETDLSSLYAHTASYEALLNKRAQKLKEVDKNNLTEEKTLYFFKTPRIALQQQTFYWEYNCNNRSCQSCHRWINEF
jgi:arsenate reductase-like glutaredoxin family protein